MMRGATYAWKWTDVVMAVATVAIAVLGYFQYQDLKRGGDDTHILATSALLSTRAWISVVGTGFGYTIDGPHASGRIIIENTGTTPASNIHLWRCSQVRDTEPPVGDVPPSDNPDCVADNIGTIGKNATVTFNGFDQTQITPKGLPASSRDDGAHFYFWGRIVYDIYTKDRSHFSNFCLLNAGDQLAPCLHGNDAN